MNLKTRLMALSLALLLAACGDSPQDLATPAQAQGRTADVPASALGTTTAYSQFAETPVTTETGKPIEVNGVTPPTSETVDPIPVL